MTQEEFKSLPALLTRKKFREITGLSARDLDAERRSGGVRAWKGAGRTCHLYYKEDAARIANFKL